MKVYLAFVMTFHAHLFTSTHSIKVYFYTCFQFVKIGPISLEEEHRIFVWFALQGFDLWIFRCSVDFQVWLHRFLLLYNSVLTFVFPSTNFSFPPYLSLSSFNCNQPRFEDSQSFHFFPSTPLQPPPH